MDLVLTRLVKVKTDRSLPDRMQRIRDPTKRRRKLSRRYAMEKFALGAASTSVGINALMFPTHGANAAKNLLQIRAAGNNCEIIEELARQEGVDIRSGPRKRYIVAGIFTKLAFKAVFLSHDDTVHALETVTNIVDGVDQILDYFL